MILNLALSDMIYEELGYEEEDFGDVLSNPGNYLLIILFNRVNSNLLFSSSSLFFSNICSGIPGIKLSAMLFPSITKSLNLISISYINYSSIMFEYSNKRIIRDTLLKVLEINQNYIRHFVWNDFVRLLQ